jgi:hypothetical protein
MEIHRQIARSFGLFNGRPPHCEANGTRFLHTCTINVQPILHCGHSRHSRPLKRMYMLYFQCDRRFDSRRLHQPSPSLEGYDSACQTTRTRTASAIIPTRAGAHGGHVARRRLRRVADRQVESASAGSSPPRRVTNCHPKNPIARMTCLESPDKADEAVDWLRAKMFDCGAVWRELERDV